MNAITAIEVGIRLSPSVGLALGTGVFGLKDRSLARLADASDRRDNHRHLGEENLGNLCLAGDNAGRQNLFAIGRSVGCLHIRSLLDRGLVANYSVAFLRKRCRVEKSKTAPKKGNNTHAVLGSGTVVIGGAPFPPLPPLSSLSDFSPLSPLSPLPLAVNGVLTSRLSFLQLVHAKGFSLERSSKLRTNVNDLKPSALILAIHSVHYPPHGSPKRRRVSND
jgi:hypothetical protein